MTLNQIILTRECNRNCLYCCAKHILKDKEEISIKDFEFYLNKVMPKLKEDKIRFLGGEPLLHSNIRRILRLTIKNNFKKIMISTNGLFDYDIFLNIKSLSNFYFTFSYPNNNAEKRLIMKNIKYVTSKGASVDMCIVLLNDFDPNKILENVKYFNLRRVILTIALPNKEKSNKFVKVLDRRLKNNFFWLIKKLFLANIGVGQLCFTPFCIFNNKQRSFLKRYDFNYALCDADSMVYPSLDVYLCQNFNKKIGNLKKDSLMLIMEEREEQIKNNKNNMFNKCGSCIHKKNGVCLPCAAYS